MARYYAAADLDAAYARGDAGVRREAARVGMAYAEEGVKRARGRGGGGGGGDPRGLDRDSVGVDGGGGRGRGEQAEMAGVPLRARARQAARELVETFVVGNGRARSAG